MLKRPRSGEVFLAFLNKPLFVSLGCGLFGLWLCFDHSVNLIAVKVDARQAGSFTGAVTHVSQVVTANLATLGNFDLNNKWTVEQKALFDANTAGNTTNRNAARVAVFAVGADHKTLKHLDTFFGTFFNFLVHFYSVAAFNVDDFVLFELFFNFSNN